MSEQSQQEQSTQSAAQPSMISQPVAAPLWKDLLIPVSIIIAGVAVGAGLYFGGGPSGSGVIAVSGGAQETFQDRVTRLADDAGVKKRALDACMEERREEMAARVQEDVDNAVATGGGGTPWSVVVGPTGKTYPLNGAVPAQAIEQVIELARSEGDLPNTTEGANTDAVNPVTEADYIKGSRNAAVTIIEYSDFDCPFCSRFHSTMNQVVSQYDDVAWVYRHFPLDQLHPNARTAAIVAECVGELEGNDAFWNFTDAYFAGS